jgi:phenylacetate-CoA ligase
MPSLLHQALMPHRLAALTKQIRLYTDVVDPDAITARQVLRFNNIWRRAWEEIPFYRDWRDEHELPAAITTLAELDNFPLITKSVIRERAALVSRTPGATRSTLTGGTSGLSTAFPMNDRDARSAWVDTHIGRKWNDIEPGDRLFMIWGHSHLFSGRGAWGKQLARTLKDRVNGIARVSAYNLDEPELAAIIASLRRFRPTYLIAYGSCLMRVCAYAEARREDLAGLGIHRVVNTSETLDHQDSSRLMALFGCPVINEYGMAEAGVLGYSQGSLYPIRLFWDDFIVRTQDGRIILTTIGERCFPLFNYDTEDLCPDVHGPDVGLLRLSSLQGKARDIFAIKDRLGVTREVSVILFDHILKQIRPLQSLHYRLLPNGEVLVRYTSGPDAPVESLLLKHLLDGLRREGIDAAPDRLHFQRLDRPLQTVAGKRSALQVDPT